MIAKLLKTSILAASLALTAPAMAQALAPAVVVIVDLERVANLSLAGKAATTELQARVATLQARARTLQASLKTEADAIQAGQANKSLAGAALQTRAQAFAQKQQAAQQELQRGDQELQRARQFVIKQITDAAQPHITSSMRERGASIAVNKNAVLQHAAGLEVTDAVLAKLNAALPKVSTTPPAAPKP